MPRIDRGIWVGQPHKDRGDMRWMVTVRRKDYADGHQRVLEGGPDRPSAEAVARQLARMLGAAGSSMVSVGDILRAYKEARIVTRRTSTEALQSGQLKNHLIPHFGARVAVNLKLRDFFDFGAAKLSGLAPEEQARRFSVVEGCLSTLRAALNWYWKEHRSTMRAHLNPAEEIGEAIERVRQRFNVPKVRRRPAYTRDHLESLLQVAREHDLLVHDLLAVAAGSGRRLGEILGIQWSNLDLLRCRLVPDERGALYSISQKGTPSLWKVERIGPSAFDPSLVPIFERRMKLRTSQRWVFANDNGEPLKGCFVQKHVMAVRKLAKARGVPLDRSFHSTRHAFASLLLESGERSLHWVSRQLGHASPEFTARQYGHALDDERGVNVLDFLHRSHSVHGPAQEADGSEPPKRLN